MSSIFCFFIQQSLSLQFIIEHFIQGQVMANYIKQEMPDMLRKGEQKAYYRLQITQNVNFQSFLEYMCSRGGGMNKGDALKVLIRATETLTELLAEGYSVTIDDLGIFKATIGLEEGKEMDELDGDKPKYNARSLRLNGINFQADKNLVYNANRLCKLERAGTSRIRRSPFSKEERLQKAMEHLDKHGMIRVKDYMELVGLSHTKAAEELRIFSQDTSSGITSVGRLAGKIYVKSSKE